jgi:hypothetical protein
LTSRPSLSKNCEPPGIINKQQQKTMYRLTIVIVLIGCSIPIEVTSLQGIFLTGSRFHPSGWNGIKRKHVRLFRSFESRNRMNDNDNQEGDFIFINEDQPFQKDTTSGSNQQLSKSSFRRKQRSVSVGIDNMGWLEQATNSLLACQPGTLTEGKWHQVVSLFTAWSNLSKNVTSAPVQMEALLKLLIDERLAGNDDVVISIELYTTLLDAWACSALFHQTVPPNRASQRAREILVWMQENYEKYSSGNGGDIVPFPLQPDRTNFRIVLHCVCRIEGAVIARRLLAWMEYLTKSGKNVYARPQRSDYILILNGYANMDCNNDKPTTTTLLTEGFIRHMNSIQSSGGLVKSRKMNDDARADDEVELMLPDTYCYNILLKAWNKQVSNKKRGGREAAEQADRILEEMKESGAQHCRPDLVTYSCK